MQSMCTFRTAHVRNARDVHNICPICQDHMCAMHSTYARSVHKLCPQCPLKVGVMHTTHVRNAQSMCAQFPKHMWRCPQHMCAMCTVNVCGAQIAHAQWTCTAYMRNSQITCAQCAQHMCMLVVCTASVRAKIMSCTQMQCCICHIIMDRRALWETWAYNRVFN